MTDSLKQQSPLILAAVKQSRKVLLHCHPSPDGDSVGSTLAFHHLLTGMGKKVVHISGDTDIPVSFASLPGFTDILKQKYFDTELSDIDTFIILDSSSTEQITKLDSVSFPPTLNTIVIDHHPSNTGFGNINLIEPSYIAVGQLVYDLFKDWQVEITPDMALCLFMAIYDDSGGFKYQLTTPETIFAAAELAKINPRFPQAIFQYQNSIEQPVLDYIGWCLSTSKKYFSGRVVIAATPQTVLLSKNINAEQTEKTEITNMLKSVIGNDIAVTAVERRPGVINLSMRTRDPEKFDLSKLAMAVGHGGGHKAAAGAVIYSTFTDSIPYLLRKIQETYPELGNP